MLGVLTVVLVLPSFILIADKLLRHTHKTIIPRFDGLNRFIVSHRAFFVILALLLFFPALYAQNNVHMYYKLDESLPRDLPSIVANERLKDEFNMATSHFVLLRDDLSGDKLGEMESRLRDVPGVTDLVSYHSLLGSGIPDFFIPDELKDILRQGGRQMMMVNSSFDTASPEVSDQLEQMKAIIYEYDPDAMITGEAALTDDLIETTAVDFRVTNYVSVAAIFLIIAVVFRSVSVPVVLVGMIELAIFINQGVPYFTGAAVAFVAPTVISCVQLGATVDYAILMTSRFQEELRAGRDCKEAAIIAASASDGSIITSALVMFTATLGVSLVTSIDLIGAICAMLARGAVISALVSIFLMPAVLCACEPLFARTSLRWRGAKDAR